MGFLGEKCPTWDRLRLQNCPWSFHVGLTPHTRAQSPQVYDHLWFLQKLCRQRKDSPIFDKHHQTPNIFQAPSSFPPLISLHKEFLLRILTTNLGIDIWLQLFCIANYLWVRIWKVGGWGGQNLILVPGAQMMQGRKRLIPLSFYSWDRRFSWLRLTFHWTWGYPGVLGCNHHTPQNF